LNILFVYPRYPDTFWSFRHALKFIAKKAAYPPLGLLTVASLLPREWEKKLVDMNADDLNDEDIAWADYVFISGMDVQRQSAHEVVKRCSQLGTKMVAGGPLFTTGHEEFPEVDHFVLGEAEVLMSRLVTDLERGKGERFYQSDERPDIRKSPVPAWDLIDTRKYATLSLQYSRGCPFDCEFCDIVLLNGRVPRTKEVGQLVEELDAIHCLGCCSTVFIVDDNFIGNKKKLKAEVLPAIIDWMKEKGYPFTLFTQASIGLADDEELMRMMTDAGFDQHRHGPAQVGVASVDHGRVLLDRHHLVRIAADTQDRNAGLGEGQQVVDRVQPIVASLLVINAVNLLASLPVVG